MLSKLGSLFDNDNFILLIFTAVQEKSVDNEDGVAQWMLQECNASQPLYYFCLESFPQPF